MKNWIKKYWKRIVLFFVLFIFIILGAGFAYVRSATYEAMPEALAILQDEEVSIENNMIRVEPETEVVGNIVFYQGGFVEPEAYLPLAKRLSEEGYNVYIPHMPLNLAILGINRFEDVIEAYPSDQPWYIAGHSLGGTSGLLYTIDHLDQIEGALLMGSYPSDGADLSQSDLTVLSIYATNDQVINEERYEAARALLPEDTTYEVIEGGNHSNFGYYGFQKGDGKSENTREEQLEEVVKSFLQIVE
ncbi:alpha/beta hydrolase [Marinilactibacillus kalidii]|uniref:alpha/beta hydrolase n=1 Tax=Marinilactibacillus kalidii TaxID=2820274 RepID=UPI001ABECCD7|nr:alpha/beta hydrolase [Marinilactibacillus kalidii]